MQNGSKTIHYFSFLLLLSIALVACDKQDITSSTGDNVDSVAEFLLHDKGLKITLLTDDEDNETSYFDSYIFVFRADGTVAATNTAATITGNYSVFRDDGRIELRMSFPIIPKFHELNDDWYFISINQDKIRFDDSGDILEFQQQ